MTEVKGQRRRVCVCYRASRWKEEKVGQTWVWKPGRLSQRKTKNKGKDEKKLARINGREGKKHLTKWFVTEWKKGKEKKEEGKKAELNGEEKGTEKNSRPEAISTRYSQKEVSEKSRSESRTQKKEKDEREEREKQQGGVVEWIELAIVFCKGEEGGFVNSGGQVNLFSGE